MALLRDGGAGAVWRGHGLQRVGRDCGAGESQPVSLRDEAGHLDADRIRRDVRHDAIRLSAFESPVDCLRLAVRHHCIAACGVRFSGRQRRSSLDQGKRLFDAAIRTRKAVAGDLRCVFHSAACGRRTIFLEDVSAVLVRARDRRRTRAQATRSRHGTDVRNYRVHNVLCGRRARPAHADSRRCRRCYSSATC